MTTLAANTFCSFCGVRFDTDTWPRTCGSCKRMTWRNPLPVVVALTPVGKGILTVRRSIEPGKGKLALPGGYVDFGETWQEALVRELREETEALVDPAKIEFYGIRSSTTRTTLLIFGKTPSVSLPESFTPNEEVSELVVLTEPVELAFPTHTEMVRKVWGH